MKTKTKLGLAAASALLVQTGSATILLAGFNKFQVVPDGILVSKNPADEGVFAATSEISYRGGSSATGGSTDNWYGPESLANGGMMTNQLPFNPLTTGVNPTINGPYSFEPDPARLVDGYQVGAPTPSNIAPDGVTSSTANGRIVNLNGADLVVTNDSNQAYRLNNLLLDSFVGDVSSNSDSTGMFNPFTVNIILNGESVSTQNFSPTRGYAGENSLSGEPVDGLLADPNSVNNKIDYGVGTNYLDYVVNLGGLLFRPADRVEIGFAYTSDNGGILRGDNFALTASAVPEPSSALVLGGLLGLSLLGSRRRK